MARPHSTRYTVAALLLLGAAVMILASLGQWQLRRGDERRAILAAIEAGLAGAAAIDPRHRPRRHDRVARCAGHRRVVAAIQCTAGQPQPGRQARLLAGYAHCCWMPTRGARCWCCAGGCRAPCRRRGRFPARGRAQPSLPATPEGPQTVTGELSPRVPRLFELWSLGGSGPVRPAGSAAGGRAAPCRRCRTCRWTPMPRPPG